MHIRHSERSGAESKNLVKQPGRPCRRIARLCSDWGFRVFDAAGLTGHCEI